MTSKLCYFVIVASIFMGIIISVILFKIALSVSGVGHEKSLNARASSLTKIPVSKFHKIPVKPVKEPTIDIKLIRTTLSLINQFIKTNNYKIIQEGHAPDNSPDEKFSWKTESIDGQKVFVLHIGAGPWRH